MQKTTDWLLEEQIPATGAGLLLALETIGARPLTSQNPVEYMKDLLAPVECHAHTIDRLSNLFTYGQAVETISPSPRAVIHLMTAELAGDAPVKPHAAALMAQAYLKMNNLAAAEISALAALKAGETSAITLEIALGAALNRGEKEAALELTTLAAAQNPEDAQTLIRLAAAMKMAGDPKSALKLLADAARTLEKEKPGQPKALNHIRLEMAELNLLTGEHQSGLLILREIASGAQTDPETALNAAWTMYEAGQAAEAMEIAVKFKHSHPAASTLIGRIAFDQGQDQDAFGHFQNAAEKDPSNTTAIIFMSMIALRNRQLGTALELALLAAQSQDENLAKAWLLASDALRLSGNRDEAREALAQAAKAARGDETILTEIASREKILTEQPH